MKSIVESFPQQLEESIQIASNWKLESQRRGFKNVLVCGLGGSGIGGTILSELVSDKCSIPVAVSKTYNIPGWADSDTLMIACSYSGNTEETIESFGQARAKGLEIAAITSGGKLEELCAEINAPVVKIPAGLPPRGAFGFPIVQLLNILRQYELTDSSLYDQLPPAATFLAREQENIRRRAQELTEKLHGKITVLYGDADIEGVLVRFRQQINENSKMLCWHHVYPEMNHNELVGWTKEDDQLAVVTFHTSQDHRSVSKRMEICNGVYRRYTPHVFDVKAEGANHLEEVFYLIHLGDFISVMLAEKKGIDPVEVNIITHLKGELAKFNAEG